MRGEQLEPAERYTPHSIIFSLGDRCSDLGESAAFIPERECRGESRLAPRDCKRRLATETPQSSDCSEKEDAPLEGPPWEADAPENSGGSPWRATSDKCDASRVARLSTNLPRAEESTSPGNSHDESDDESSAA